MLTSVDGGVVNPDRDLAGVTDKDVEMERRVIHFLDKAALHNLEVLARIAKDRSFDFSEAIKAIAKKAKIEAPALRKVILARVSDKLEEKKEEAHQASLLFEVLGE